MTAPRPDPSRPDTSRPDPSRPDPSRPDHSRQDLSRADPSQDDPSRADPSRPDLPLLAELDAGALDHDRARAVRAGAESDPAALAVLGALAATRAELAALPDPPVPPALAGRWSAALRAEQLRLSTPSASAATDGATTDRSVAVRDDAPAASAREAHLPSDRPAPTPTPDQSTLRPPHGHAGAHGHGVRRPASRPPLRRLPLLRRPAVLAGALLVAVLVGAGLLNARHEQPATVYRTQLVAQGLSTVGARDTGGLDDPERRAACLQTVAAPGVAPAAALLGGRRVVFEGRPGVLLVLGTRQRGTFDIVIVDSACGISGGTLLAATHVAPP